MKNERGQRPTGSSWRGRAEARRWWRLLVVSMVVVGLVGCATVPPQAVLLSRALGRDLVSVQVTYRQLIRTHFADQRERIRSFIETRWKPAYLRDYIERGELVKLASAGDPTVVFEGVEDWVTIALEEIAEKRDSLLTPIDRQEESLLSATDEAFAQMLQANSVVTAHLESVRHVQAEQDEVLQRAGLKSVRDRIDAGLAEASTRTQAAIDTLESSRRRLEAVAKKRKPLHH